MTFLASNAGGRLTSALDSPSYQPHLVIGDLAQRVVLVDGRAQIVENYLGVRFTGTGQELQLGVEHTVELSLMYPEVDYSALVVDTTFTIREGSKIVGFGRVLQ